MFVKDAAIMIHKSRLGKPPEKSGSYLSISKVSFSAVLIKREYGPVSLYLNTGISHRWGISFTSRSASSFLTGPPRITSSPSSLFVI
jgi:hypothetical protein